MQFAVVFASDNSSARDCERAIGRDSSVVDEDIDRTERLLNCLAHRIDLVTVRDIGLN